MRDKIIYILGAVALILLARDIYLFTGFPPERNQGVIFKIIFFPRIADGRRPGQRGSGAAYPRFAGRGRPRAADDLRVQRPVGLHHARRGGKVVWAMFTARHAPPSPARYPGRPGGDPVPGTAR